MRTWNLTGLYKSQQDRTPRQRGKAMEYTTGKQEMLLDKIAALEQDLLSTSSELADADREIAKLKQELAEARREIESLKSDRKQVVSYLKAVSDCAKAHPEGYTIVDFQQVWLDQERDTNRKLEQERDALKSEVERVTLRWQTGPIPKGGAYWFRNRYSPKASRIGWLTAGENDCLSDWAGPIPEPQEPKP